MSKSTYTYNFKDKPNITQSILGGERSTITIHAPHSTQKKDEVLAALHKLQTKLAQATDLERSKAERLERNLDVVIEAVDNSNPNDNQTIEELTSMQKIITGGIALGETISQLWEVVL